MIKPSLDNTVQELIDGGYSITIRAATVVPVVCSRCGGREFGMTKTPPTMRKGPGWT